MFSAPVLEHMGHAPAACLEGFWNTEIRHPFVLRSNQVSKLRRLEFFFCEGFMTFISTSVISVLLFAMHSTGWRWQTWIWHPWLGSQIGPGKSKHELCCLVESTDTPATGGTSIHNPRWHTAGNDVGLRNSKNGTKQKLAFPHFFYIQLLTLILFNFK